MAKSYIKSRPRVVLINRTAIINNDGDILIIKRSETDSWQANKWEFPGGKLDLGQDINNALEREVLEETGILVKVSDTVTYVESFLIGDGKYKGLPLVSITYKATPISHNVKLSEEHSEYKWIAPEEALEQNLTDEARKALLTFKLTKV